MKQYFNLTAKRLHQKGYFEEILDYNRANAHRWSDVFPHHQEWVAGVVEGLIKDNYSRMAFGVIGKRSGKRDELLLSCVVNRNPFTTFLELKNFIFFEEKISNYIPKTDNYAEEAAELKQVCFASILLHIKKFAANRGYPKVVTEVINRNERERDLIKALVFSDFEISGNQSGRYRHTDEFVHLTCDVLSVYGYDPFDAEGKARWILKNYCNSHELHSRRVNLNLKCELADASEAYIQKQVMVFCRNYHKTAPADKFNCEDWLLVVEPYFPKNHNVLRVVKIEGAEKCLGTLFIFDFSKENAKTGGDSVFVDSVFADLTGGKVHWRCFSSEILENLLNGGNQDRQGDGGRKSSVRPVDGNRLSFSDVGGFLLYSDPERFEHDRVAEIIQSKKTPIYIKIGPKGRFLQQGQKVFFVYPLDNLSEEKCSLWGCATVEKVVYVNFIQLRDNNACSAGYSDSDLLWQRLDLVEENEMPDMLEMSFSGYMPIWENDEFAKHNKYNATKEVVCLYIKEIHTCMQNPISIKGEDLGVDLEEVAFDLDLEQYLSEEVAKQLAIKVKSKSNDMDSRHNSTGQLRGIEGFNYYGNEVSKDIVADVVFIHGLEGDPENTWTRKEDSRSFFWPKMLNDDNPRIRVTSIGYDARITRWFDGDSMGFNERAANILFKIANAGFGARPLIFVCHSFGGLVLKSMLRTVFDTDQKDCRFLLRKTKAVVFLGTPHSGANLASWGKALKSVFRVTQTVDDLAAGNPALRNLNTWYKMNSEKFGIQTRIFYETKPTHGVKVVDIGSSDIGMTNVNAIPLDCDHLELSKVRRDSPQYVDVIRLAEALG